MWEDADQVVQKKIVEDLQKRWRSVTDRFMKAEAGRSGSSPLRRRVPYADQLAFILTSRNLRRSEGNVPTPTVHHETSTEQGGEEDSEDFLLCSPDPHGAGPSCSPASASSFAAGVAPGSGADAAPASEGSSAVGASRPTGMGAGSARPVALRKAGTKKPKIQEVASSALEALTTRTLSLMDRVQNEDHLHHFCLSLAGHLRSMPRDRQNVFMAAVNTLAMAIDVPSPIPLAPAIINDILNIFNPSGPPPPTAAATHRYGQVAAYRHEASGAHGTYGCPPAPGAAYHRPGPSQNSSFSQDMFQGYGYDPEFQQLP
ncbi:uncharacterized protein [Phyllobates terribilis]|uniref:uncharacterized protein n=1 Tax=Phyllobates terribilis TaxID=111132 RepID=UPI003CCB7395